MKMIPLSLSLSMGLVAALMLPPAQAQTLQVVTETSPYAYLRGGKVAGPATEIVERSLQQAGLTDYRVHIYPWARSYDLASNEPNVLIYLIARTPAREAAFKWVGEFMKIQYHFYKLKERTDIVVKKLDDARHYTVGVLRDDVRHQYLLAKGFTRLVVAGQGDDNFKRLLNRQVQLVALPELDTRQFCEQMQVDCSRLERLIALDETASSLYLAYSRSTPDEVVARTRATFEKLKAEGAVRKVLEN